MGRRKNNVLRERKRKEERKGNRKVKKENKELALPFVLLNNGQPFILYMN
jgi:hypothetical protein